MGRLRFMAFVFASIVLFSQSVLAADFIPVEVGIEPKSIRTDLGNPVIFSLNVKNNQNFEEQLRIAVDGPHIHWVTNPIILLVVPKNSSKEVKLTFYPVQYRGRFNFDIVTSSHKTFLELDSQSVYIEIPPLVTVENFTLERQGSIITAGIDVETMREYELNFSTILMNSSGHVISSALGTHIILGKKSFSQELFLPENPLAGEYTIDYGIYNITGKKTFVVEPIHIVERSEKLVANAMFGVVTVTYKNLGNTAERKYATEEILPKTTITGFITTPNNCEEGLIDKTCTYIISDIQPGATAQVSYRVEYWPYYIQLISAVIIIFIIASFTVLRAAQPTIGKTSVKKSTNMHSVILEVRNPFLHHLKDVVIRDWVSPLAGVVQHEAGALRPVLKRSGAGTELIWKLGEMKPKEVRYLSYKMKTLVEGNLKMPRAYARFRTPNGGRSKVYSKFLHLN